MCFSTLKRRADKAGYSVQRGFQRYHHPGWGYRKDTDGNKIVGYQLYDYSIGAAVHGVNDLYDHDLSLEEVEALI